MDYEVTNLRDREIELSWTFYVAEQKPISAVKSRADQLKKAPKWVREMYAKTPDFIPFPLPHFIFWGSLPSRTGIVYRLPERAELVRITLGMVWTVGEAAA
jgi:hypothetical protein